MDADKSHLIVVIPDCLAIVPIVILEMGLVTSFGVPLRPASWRSCGCMAIPQGREGLHQENTRVSSISTSEMHREYALAMQDQRCVTFQRSVELRRRTC